MAIPWLESKVYNLEQVMKVIISNQRTAEEKIKLKPKVSYFAKNKLLSSLLVPN